MKRILAIIPTFVMILGCMGIHTGATQTANVAAESRHGVVRVIAITEVTASTVFFSKGSGFAVGVPGEDPTIFVTNQHVVDGGLSYYILLDNDWKQSVPEFGGKSDNKHAVKCEIVYVTDGEPDFAILKAARAVPERTPMSLMMSHLATPGDTIFTLGYPGVADDIEEKLSADIDSISITRGTISRFTTMEVYKSKAIQIDADINKGNSGGPLITEDGAVIGINTWYWAEQNVKICLALDIDYVIEKLTELQSNGTLRGFEFALITELIEETIPETKPQETEEEEEDKEEEEEVEEEEKQGAIGSGALAAIFLAGIVAGSVIVIVLMVKKTSAKKRKKKVSGTPRQFRLVGTEGAFESKRIALDHELILGRDSACDLVFPADTPGISNRHCVLTPKEDHVLLTDVGSTYGTYLAGGTRLTPNEAVELYSGDRFYLADARQSFVIDHKR